MFSGVVKRPENITYKIKYKISHIKYQISKTCNGFDRNQTLIVQPGNRRCQTSSNKLRASKLSEQFSSFCRGIANSIKFSFKCPVKSELYFLRKSPITFI